MAERFTLAVLVSGTGSNLRALVEAIDAGRCGAKIVAVLADRPCRALAFARERGLDARTLRPRDYADRESWNRALAVAMAECEPNLVVCAGFMRIIGAPVLNRFEGRIINVHPSLLPRFPGMHAPQQALDAGVEVTGCTVHYVDRGVDTGAILAQAEVPVRGDDDAASLHRRIQAEEHRLLVEVVDRLARSCERVVPTG